MMGKNKAMDRSDPSTCTAEGPLKLEPSTRMTNPKLEVLIVMQPIAETEVDALGWPIGFSDRTYGALADDAIDRPADVPLDVRDDIE
jgi:hypothetical protein